MTRSPLAAPRRLPRVRLAPRSVESDAEDAIELAAAYGLTPFDWQEDVLTDWMGRRRDGRWAATTCGLAVPRQNGKNAVIEIREFYGAAILGERIIHTAHQVKTAREAFMRVASFFEDDRHPEIKSLVREVRRANGQEAVTLKNGGQIRFIARSGPSGRGMSIDTLILDEAQDLSEDELAALQPMMSTSSNPQLILTGTPPDPDRFDRGFGAAFARVREIGTEKRDARLAWIDYGVEDGPIPDTADRDVWSTCNPSLAEGLISADNIASEHVLMSPETFARERLGWWGDPAAELACVDFPVDAWNICTDPSAANSPAKMTAFAVEVDLDRTWASIGAAGVRRDGRVQLEMVDRRRGMAWLAERCIELNGKHGPARFVIDGAGPAQSLEDPLKVAGVDVVMVGAGDVAAACAGIVDAVIESAVAHGPDGDLQAAVEGCRKRVFRDGGFAFSRRRSDVDVTPLMAVTLAHWATVNAKRPPEVWSLAETVERLQKARAQDADSSIRPDGSRFVTF